MSDDGRSWHWHEYPVGLGGEVARASVRALFAFLIGLAAAFVLMMIGGILAEEHLFNDPGLEHAIDDLARMSAGMVMVFALVAWAAFALAVFLRELTTSRALVKAAARGASRHEVPSPEQVISVTREPAMQLTIFGWGNAAMAGIFGIIGLGIAIAEDDGSEDVLVFWLLLGYAALMALLGLAGPKRLTPAHERRQALIAANWSSSDEAAAWKRSFRSPGNVKLRYVTPAERCLFAATALLVLGFVALQASVTMRCGATPKPGAQCDEVTYNSFIERLLAGGLVIFAVLVPLAGILAVAGVLLDWRRRRAERAELLERLADPRAGRPAEDLLAHHAQRRMHPLALVGAALSGIGLVFSVSSYMVGQGKGLGSEDVFVVYREESIAVMIVSGCLFVAALLGNGVANVRGRDLRNELMRRWPTRPVWSAGEDGRILRAKRGPALHGPRYVKVGKNARST
ncbi:hypothetical protein LO763_26420 [Glycomyces sp. A-F 0318]|uniref:hypothetical protein n=1 Tax=Glycomyces amatae TaxID=2881355 RepID=UPI001E288A60|nr:hypothetical protein [Glycomyces amatae]MCD0447157.1 hypothetical protein [Glycomyces amatae]